MCNLLMLCAFETASIIFSYQGSELLPACLFIRVPDDGYSWTLWQKTMLHTLLPIFFFNDTSHVKAQRAQWLLVPAWLWISLFHTPQPLKRLAPKTASIVFLHRTLLGYIQQMVFLTLALCVYELMV